MSRPCRIGALASFPRWPFQTLQTNLRGLGQFGTSLQEIRVGLKRTVEMRDGPLCISTFQQKLAELMIESGVSREFCDRNPGFLQCIRDSQLRGEKLDEQ